MSTRTRVTFGKSEPWSSGWKGWSNCVDIFLNGKKIGMLDADYVSNKRWLTYYVVSDHPALQFKSIGLPMKEAKQMVRERIAQAEELSTEAMGRSDAEIEADPDGANDVRDHHY